MLYDKKFNKFKGFYKLIDKFEVCVCFLRIS